MAMEPADTDMLNPSLPSRIAESAVGLAKDLLSNSAEGCGALESTNDLATLRSAHKLSSASSNGNPSSLRLSRPLSSRHRVTAGFVRTSRHSPGPYCETEAEEELSQFLLHECSPGEASASSSRSESTLDLTLDNESGDIRWHSDVLARNDSFELELSGPKQKSFRNKSGNLSGRGVLQGTSGPHNEIDPNDFLMKTNHEAIWENHQRLSKTDPNEALSANVSHDTEMVRRKQRTLGRLQLIFSHMSRATLVEGNVVAKQMDVPDVSYNQLCVGEESQEWAEFEASLSHCSAMYATWQDHPQEQQTKQAISAESSRQALLRGYVHDGHTAQQPEQSIETALPEQLRHQTSARSQEQQKEKEPLPEFHCPWVECHHVSDLP